MASTFGGVFIENPPSRSLAIISFYDTTNDVDRRLGELSEDALTVPAVGCRE